MLGGVFRDNKTKKIKVQLFKDKLFLLVISLDPKRPNFKKNLIKKNKLKITKKKFKIISKLTSINMKTVLK